MNKNSNGINDHSSNNMLNQINSPDDLKKLSISQLEILADELRDFILKNVSLSGGHLASSLGTVELTLALHYIFDTPKDKIIWDVGHQTYAHKIITGRRDKFHTIRSHKGLSGFPNPQESEFDTFITGHASTSISAALGMACARDLNKDNFRVIAVIGDGSLSGGLAYEALNNIGELKKDMILILNDNKMSISHNVGAMANYLNRLITGDLYNVAKRDVEDFLGKLAIGKKVINFTHKLEGVIKGFIVPGMLFEEMGLRYIGPIDGHNIRTLLDRFQKVKKLKGPILIHIFTKKGKGYKLAEEDPTFFHSAPKFEIDEGKPTQEGETYTSVFGKTICKLAEQDNKIVAITAAMAPGTGLVEFSQHFPKRFYDVGIAESHAVTFAAGLASQGLKPVVAIYSTFLQRAFDQIIHDVCLQNLPVRFVLDRSGIVGEDGPTHHGVFDLSYLKMIPNMVIMAPKDERELQDMLKTIVEYNAGPIAVRYPRGRGTGIKLKDKFDVIPVGKGELLKDGDDGTIFAIGKTVEFALKASDMLSKERLNLGVVNLRFAKPLDRELILRRANKTEFCFSVEDNTVEGGIGSSIQEIFNEINGRKKILHIFGFPDKFIEHGDPDTLYDKYGLSPRKLSESIKNIIKSSPRVSTKQ